MRGFGDEVREAAIANKATEFSSNARALFLLLGEKVRVRASLRLYF